MNRNIIFFLCAAILLNLGCKDDVLPKPKAMLRLEYDAAATKQLDSDCPFNFEYNQGAHIQVKDNCNMVIDYPEMKGSIYLSYKEVKGDLKTLLTDAQKLSYEHVQKADNILEQPFLNGDEKVFGMFYEVTGNAASQSQFYATDSIQHFVTGSLYFYAKPNYDSIYPAAIYLQKDIRKIMETLRWQ